MTQQTRNIVITTQDHERLGSLIHECREYRLEESECLMSLLRELEKAEVVESGEVPPDVVTMNSTVAVRMEGSRQDQHWTIVYPEAANLDENRISVLAPLGTALLGYRAGDTFEWNVPAGHRRYHVKKIVHQPEAAGEWER